MTTDHRYSPPTAAVADITESAEFQPVHIWSARGRIGRLRFLAYSFTGYLLIGFLGGMVAGIAGAALGATAFKALSMCVYIAISAFSFLQTIKRSHDMGWNGWTSLLSLIPFVGLIWLFKAGTPDANDYGAPPPPNTTGVRILGFLMPVIFIIGIFAAIAIPAYQQYVLRAGGTQ
jgi:uncharacterized membrane protein YhaH (DUF805 family)